MTADRPFPAFVKRLDRPWRIVVGLLLVGLGLWLVTRPLVSLTLLTAYVGVTLLAVGVGDLLQGRGAAQRRDVVRSGFGLLWIVIGAGVLVLRTDAAAVLPLILGLLMASSGLLRILRSRRTDSGSRDRRWSSTFLGVAETALGVLALMWPDVTLVIAAVLFGIRAVVLGGQLLAESLLRRREASEASDAGEESGAPKRRGVGRLVASVTALALALGVLGVSVLTRVEETPTLTPPPQDADLSVAGSLLDAEEFTAEIPDGADGWRISYATVDQHGDPTWASALVVVPQVKEGAGGHDVVVWAHGTTGQARHCAPSLMPKPFTAGAFPEVMDEVVERGWAVVAPDYVGLGGAGEHPYLIGEVAGTAMLDAVRAARQLRQADLGTRTAVWGHSQGGGAALWTAQMQPTYAPDVPIVGTVAMAPATDLPAIAAGLAKIPGGSVFASYVVAGYAATYDDVTVRGTVRPAAVPLVEQMTSRCLTEPGVLASVLTALSLGDSDVIRPEALRGDVGRHLSDNVPTALGEAPVLVAQGADDQLISPQKQADWVKRVQRAGYEPEFELIDGLDHLTLVQEGSAFLPELVDWTAARFDD